MTIVVNVGNYRTTTAKRIVLRALGRLGVTTPTEEPAAEDTQHAFDALNEMLDQWAVQRLMIPSIQRLTYSLAAATSSYSIGPNATFDCFPRPVSIEQGMTVAVGTLDYDVLPITQAQYAGITDKTTPGRPENFYYEPGNELGTLYFWPVPDSAYTVSIPVMNPLAAFESQDGAYFLPSGYEASLSWALAEYLMPDYGRILPAITSMATRFRTQLKRRNLDNTVWIEPRNDRFNILIGR